MFLPVTPAAPTGPQPEDLRSRSLVRPAVLLLLRDHESHGYELIGRLVELGVKTPNRGALYRLLRTMADEGLITWYWSTPKHGPARRVYALTEQGEQHLEASMAMLASLARTVRGMLNRYRSGC
jgi:poly-beta-hydroxybutyrate-responsive repressor